MINDEEINDMHTVLYNGEIVEMPVGEDIEPVFDNEPPIYGDDPCDEPGDSELDWPTPSEYPDEPFYDDHIVESDYLDNKTGPDVHSEDLPLEDDSEPFFKKIGK